MADRNGWTRSRKGKITKLLKSMRHKCDRPTLIARKRFLNCQRPGYYNSYLAENITAHQYRRLQVAYNNPSLQQLRELFEVEQVENPSTFERLRNRAFSCIFSKNPKPLIRDNLRLVVLVAFVFVVELVPEIKEPAVSVRHVLSSVVSRPGSLARSKDLWL